MKNVRPVANLWILAGHNVNLVIVPVRGALCIRNIYLWRMRRHTKGKKSAEMVPAMQAREGEELLVYALIAVANP